MEQPTDIVLANLATGDLVTEYGRFSISVFHDGLEEAVVLWMGQLEEQHDVLCRIHSECIASHVFFSTECDCSSQMRSAQQKIAGAGQGLIIYLRHEGKGNGAAAHVATQSLKARGMTQGDAYLAAGFQADNRSYNIAGKIIQWFRIRSISPLPLNSTKLEALQRVGISIGSKSPQ